MSEKSNKHLKALIVDDHMAVRALIAQCLITLDIHDADTAANSAEALQKLSQKNYDIVFLDWNMPGQSGYALLQQCRQDRQYDNVAFVMVTAETQERYLNEALKAGANSCITKPFSRDTFRARVERVLVWLENRGAKPDKSKTSE